MLFVLDHMEIVLEPNIASDLTKVFLDDPEWPKHIPQLKQIKRPTFLKYMITLVNFVVNYNCSLTCIKKNVVNYSYFRSCTSKVCKIGC